TSAIRPFSTSTAPFGRPRKAPNSGASIKKPRRPNRVVLLCIDRGGYQNILTGGAATPQLRGDLRKKRFGQRTPRRNSKYEKRATARIALTCLFGQQATSGVRIFYDFFGRWKGK